MTSTQSRYLNTLRDQQNSVKTIQDAHYQHQFDQVIERSTHAISHIQRELIAALDTRAHQFGMKGQFGKAVKDAEKIVRCTPTRAMGYLRLGQLLSMQGKQSAAIQIYQKGLTNVKQEDDLEAYTNLAQGKEMAMEKNKQVLDFVMLFPLEVADVIFQYLQEWDWLECMEVSTGWRDRLVNSPKAWTSIEVYYNTSNDYVASVLRIVPYIGQHVKHIMVGTKPLETGRAYLEYMEKGFFKRIQSLELSDASELTSPDMIKLFTNALLQTHNTMTKLELKFGCNDKNINMKIADLLFCCPNLKTLIYEARSSSLAATVGDMEHLVEPHLALEDIKLEIELTTGEALKPILQYCPNIRRLYLAEDCEPYVLDVVNECCHKNLQIFVYNARSSEVSTLEQMDKEDYDGPPGLREIITSDEFSDGAPTKNFLQLLHQHQKSLKTVIANLSTIDEPEVTGRPYKQWHFERIRNLTYWPDQYYYVTDPLFLESIRKTTSLESFAVLGTPNLPMAIDTLMGIPPVKKLEVGWMEHDDSDNDQRPAALIRLFQHYAASALEEQKLRDISLKSCNFITNQVLTAIAQLGSLRAITFSGENITSSSEILEDFFVQVGDRLTKIDLEFISCVDDDVLNAIGGMKQLEVLYMDYIYSFTDQGIINLVDQAKTLHTLILYDCAYIDRNTELYLKSKVNYFSYYYDPMNEDY